MTATSDWALIWVVAESLLFPVLGSGVADDTAAVLVIAPGATVGETVPVIVMVLLAPTAIVVALQVTLPPAPATVHAHPVPPVTVASVNVTPTGAVSVTCGLLAADGPLLVTTSV